MRKLALLLFVAANVFAVAAVAREVTDVSKSTGNGTIQTPQKKGDND